MVYFVRDLQLRLILYFAEIAKLDEELRKFRVQVRVERFVSNGDVLD